jgi:hypothetical protein
MKSLKPLGGGGAGAGGGATTVASMFGGGGGGMDRSTALKSQQQQHQTGAPPHPRVAESNSPVSSRVCVAPQASAALRGACLEEAHRWVCVLASLSY